MIYTGFLTQSIPGRERRRHFFVFFQTYSRIWTYLLGSSAVCCANDRVILSAFVGISIWNACRVLLSARVCIKIRINTSTAVGGDKTQRMKSRPLPRLSNSSGYAGSANITVLKAFGKYSGELSVLFLCLSATYTSCLMSKHPVSRSRLRQMRLELRSYYLVCMWKLDV
jgi:hypothetical protein